VEIAQHLPHRLSSAPAESPAVPEPGGIACQPQAAKLLSRSRAAKRSQMPDTLRLPARAAEKPRELNSRECVQPGKMSTLPESPCLTTHFLGRAGRPQQSRELFAEVFPPDNCLPRTP
jgi:hypothetical protein